MASKRVAAVAGAQWGVIGTGQIADCGLSRDTVARWRRHGRLHHIFSTVYAVGQPNVPPEGRLVAALLHAGPAAVLSHATAAWWWGLISVLAAPIEVSTSDRHRSIPEVLVHHPRTIEPDRHRRLPITSPSRTLLDYATTATDSALRRALAEADYLGLLDLPSLKGLLGRGRPGSGPLRRALARHEPRLALTRSDLERRFLSLCVQNGIPLPEVNARVGWMTVDVLWREHGLVVEIDGHRGHRSPAQLARDRRRELQCRRRGLDCYRYTEDQIIGAAAEVATDLAARLNVNLNGLSAR